MPRGNEGESLRTGAVVFRLGRSNDGKIAPEAFQLSGKDKEAPVPRLSSWDKSLTTVEQADALTGGKNNVAGFLPVDEVRRLRPEPDNPRLSNLDVQWELAYEAIGDGTRRVNTQAGADGHCGISGLNQGGSGTQAKNHRKSLYGQLARLATFLGHSSPGSASLRAVDAREPVSQRSLEFRAYRLPGCHARGSVD